MIKRFIIAFILLVIVCGGIVGFNIFRDNAIKQYFATMKPPAATVSTTIVKPMEWTPGIEAIGTVSAVRGVDLTVETTGIVKEILFHANQKIAEGDVLVQLDDAVERADLEAARTQATLDQQALERAQALLKRGVGNAVTVDTTSAAASTSTSQVAKLQAVLDQKQLTAPFSGTVGIPKIDLGQYLAPGTAVVTLQDLETMRVDFTVPEQQLAQLKIGGAVRLGIGGEDMPYTGEIRGIDPKIDPASRLVTVRAEVANTEGKLSPGQFVQVRVELPVEQNVLALPQTALTSSLYGDFIYVVKPAQAAPAAAAPADANPEAKPAEPATEPAKPDAAAAAESSKPSTDGGTSAAETVAEQPADPAKPAADPAAPAAAAPAAAEGDKPALALTQVFVKPGRHSKGLVEIVEGIAAGDEVVTAGQNRLFNGMSVAVDNTIDPTKPAEATKP